MITTVTGKNQVTVPAALALAEGIGQGTRLEWMRTHREHIVEIRILPAPKDLAAELRGRGKQNASYRPGAVDRLVREREQDESEVDQV